MSMKSEHDAIPSEKTVAGIRYGKVGLESTNPEGVISFQNFRWSNPHPEKTIRSIDILSACGEGVPAIAAISTEKE